jgi:type II secretory pathway component PulF
MLEEIRNAVSGGSDLADALSEFPEVFGELELGMIRAGEKGGFLEDVLLRLAQFTERAREVSGQIAGAMVYPALLTVAGIGVVVVMMVFVLPSFATMLEGMGQLPLPTRIVMGISDFLRQNLLILLGGIAVFGYALLSWMRTPDGSRTVDAIKLRVPVLAGVTLQIAVARFARTLGTLLGSGIQIGPAIKIAADAAGNKILAEELLAAAERVKQGETLAAPLADSRFFPPLLTEMIAVGEETGTLDRVLVDAAATYEREADRAVSLLVRMIEPVILVLMTGIVMVVALAAIMPALTAAANMGKR